MRTALPGLGLLLSPIAAIAQEPPPAPLPPDAIVAVHRPSRMLLSWMPGEVRCGGTAIAGMPLRRPWSSLLWGSLENLKPLTYRFDIDASGRPVSIAGSLRDTAMWSDDVEPALAASHFPAASPHQGCSVTFAPRQLPLSEAPVEDLQSYTMTPLSGPLPREGWDRIKMAGSCLDAPRPRPLVRAFPDFDKLPGTAGVKDWSMVGYDTDGAGRPKNVRLVTGTGNAALDAASLKAIRKSRFTGGARTGCQYPFWRKPAKLVAPPIAEEHEVRPADATCPEERAWATPPKLIFPEPYRRRMIEGWAIVSYDIAPWGQIGNVKVLASEPSDDFGRQAVRILENAKLAPLPQGATGCTDRVRFVIGPEGMPGDDDQAALY